ncbi:hypothetical protein BDR05DRAFT_971707 [Suillus weaverae]|nr:hypothetical protein BDR05DRAFT_971707 [Suillus weaverae]
MWLLTCRKRPCKERQSTTRVCLNFEQDSVARDCIQCGCSLSHHQSLSSVRYREVRNAVL